jgi:hypothetical protein
MKLKIAAALAISLTFTGCKTVAESTERLDVARAENKGIVLISTSLRCPSVIARLARMSDQGRYAQLNDLVALDTLLMDNKGGPSRLALTPGRYGITSLKCPRETYVAQATERRDILLGIGDIFDKPLATFDVSAGEVVDVGHLEVMEGRSRVTGRSYTFSTVAMPMPPSMLQKLAENYPELHKVRITRLMGTPNTQVLAAPPETTVSFDRK